MNITHVLVLISYLVVMVLVGAWFGRSTQTADGEDFVLAGRSLPAPVLGGTMLATFVGSGSIIGGANFAYTYGLLPGFLFFSGTVLGTVLMVGLSRHVRVFATHTVPEVFERRFNPTVRVIGTVLILFAFVGIAAYQFTGAGYIVSLITPLDEGTGSFLSMLLITFLALTGGMKSVAWTDFLSALGIVFALWVATFFVVGVDVGGLADLAQGSARLSEHSGVLGGLTAVQMLGFAIPILVLMLGDQNMYQRLNAAKSDGHAFAGAIIFAVGAVLMVTPVVLLAVASAILQPEIEADMAVLSLSSAEFTPGVIGGLLLAGALALIVTTGSSYLLTCSSNVTYDLIGQLRRKNPATDGQNLWYGRVAVFGVAVLAYVLVNFFPSVLAIQMYAYTMYGVTITPVILAALFWKRATASGAITAMLAGAVATLFWELTGRSENLNSVLVALPAAVIALVAVSLLTSHRDDEEHLDPAKA